MIFFRLTAFWTDIFQLTIGSDSNRIQNPDDTDRRISVLGVNAL